MKHLSRLSARRALLLGLLAWLCVAATCLGPILISDAQERELGLTLVGELEGGEEFELLSDPEVDAYINEVAGRIIESSPLQRSFPFTFKVVVNEQVNAFALPGGFCYVQTGLITAAQTESELVGVIAHEVSHVTCGHHRRAMASQVLIQTAEGIVFNEESPFIAVAAARIASGLGMLKFSRNQESEADQVAVEAMLQAGWNPRGLRDFFETLHEIEGREPGRIEGLLSTHPATARRITEIDELIDTAPSRSDLVGDSPQFHFIQARVESLIGQ
jgi:predicted Zn-dependent protease